MSEPPAEVPSEEFIAAHEVKFGDLAPRAGGADLLLLDIRKPEELRATGVIPGSVNVPLQELDEALSLSAAAFQARYGFQKPAPDAEVTVSCRSGRRVKLAVPVLVKHGYSNLKLYMGSLLDWQANNGRLCACDSTEK